MRKRQKTAGEKRRRGRYHAMRITERRLYRDPSRGRIAGVCAGLADYFDVDTWLVRIVAVTGLLFVPQFTLLGYIAAWIILPKLSELTDEELNWRQGTEDSLHKEYARQSRFDEALQDEDDRDIMNRRRAAFRQCRESLGRIDQRIRKLESYVTSRRYELNREFRKMAP